MLAVEIAAEEFAAEDPNRVLRATLEKYENNYFFFQIR
jgi:hypothetical protein